MQYSYQRRIAKINATIELCILFWLELPHPFPQRLGLFTVLPQNRVVSLHIILRVTMVVYSGVTSTADQIYLPIPLWYNCLRGVLSVSRASLSIHSVRCYGCARIRTTASEFRRLAVNVNFFQSEYTKLLNVLLIFSHNCSIDFVRQVCSHNLE